MAMILFQTQFSGWNASNQAFFRMTYEAFIRDHRFRDDYLRTVHQWLPVIDQKFVIADSSHDIDPVDMLRLLAIHLIVQRPDENVSQRPIFDNQYYAVKHFYFRNLAEFATKPSLKLLQSGILIATYEYGHGLIESACLTLGPCISAGMTLGLQNLREPLHRPQGTDTNSRTEERLVWWAICITDRYVYLSTQKELRDLSPSRILCLSFPPGARAPLARSMNENDFLAELEDSGSIGSPELRAFYGSNFYHQIQSCVLIRQVLGLTNAHDPLSPECQAKCDLLDSRIRQAMHINLQWEIEHMTSISESLALNRR